MNCIGMRSMGNRRVPFPVLYLHHTSRFAGAENSLLHLATHLDRSQFSPLFLCPSIGEFTERLHQCGIQVIYHEFGSNRHVFRLIKSLNKLRRVIREQGIALLHANGPQTNIPAGIAGRMDSVPVVWHARNLIRAGMIDIDRIAGFIPNRIICNSNAIRNRFRSGPASKVAKTVINGVDLSQFDLRIDGGLCREQLGLPNDAFVVGMTSRLGSEKGHAILLEALARLQGQHENLWALIVGDHVFDQDGWVPGALREQARKLNIERRVAFTGFRRDLPALYAAMDLFVLGTDAEPCGRVLFEAMAMAKPVVATANGGTPEIVVDGQTGTLFKYADSAGLAEKIAYFVTNPEKGKGMGKAGRRRIEQRFTIERHVAKTQNLYHELLRGKT